VSIRRPVMMVMFILAFVIFGAVSFTRLPVDLMPDIELPYVTVQAIYPGAGPEEIETSVIKPIEEELSLISGIKNMWSYCVESAGYVVLEFNMGADPDLAAIDVKDKVDGILYTLPDDLEKPVIAKFDINAQPIAELALVGPGSPEALRRMADQQIKDRLAKINGVASIDVSGGREREIQINLHKERLDALNLSVLQIAPIIAASSEIRGSIRFGYRGSSGA
jgi:HAE1 family hydrophobic/amphiphilic exporter-1